MISAFPPSVILRTMTSFPRPDMARPGSRRHSVGEGVPASSAPIPVEPISPMTERLQTIDDVASAATLDEILARWDIDVVFNEPDRAHEVGVRAVAIAARLGDRSRLAWCHLLVGGALASLSALTEAESHPAAASAIFRDEGEAIGLAHTLLR